MNVKDILTAWVLTKENKVIFQYANNNKKNTTYTSKNLSLQQTNKHAKHWQIIGCHKYNNRQGLNKTNDKLIFHQQKTKRGKE